MSNHSILANFLITLFAFQYGLELRPIFPNLTQSLSTFNIMLLVYFAGQWIPLIISIHACATLWGMQEVVLVGHAFGFVGTRFFLESANSMMSLAIFWIGEHYWIYEFNFLLS